MRTDIGNNNMTISTTAKTAALDCTDSSTKLNLESSKCDVDLDYEDKLETERATRQLENMNKEFILDFNLNGSEEENMKIVENSDELLSDVQNCVEIESTSIISIGNNQIVKIVQYEKDGKFIVDEEMTRQINFNANISMSDRTEATFLDLSHEPTYTEPISYEIYEETVNTNNTDDFEIQQNKSNLTEIILEEVNNDNHDFLTTVPIIKNETAKNTKSAILSPKSKLHESSETDLTSLNWLHNITNIMAMPNLPAPPSSPKSKTFKQKIVGNSFSNSKMSSPKPVDLTIDITSYKQKGEKKPPFSYATLICMAMGKNGNKMTLSAIYHWIRENFLYYRKAHPSWQNSIRHNLSLNKCFVKQAREREEPGKGGFWKLDLERLEESRKSKRKSNLTVRAKKQTSHKFQLKPAKKLKRYRPPTSPGERKHNILSNISICGATNIENVEEAARKHNKLQKKDNYTNEKKSLKQNTRSSDEKHHAQQLLVTVPPSMPQQPSIAETVAPAIVGEDELTGLLLASNGWDDSQLEMLDSILDSL